MKQILGAGLALVVVWCTGALASADDKMSSMGSMKMGGMKMMGGMSHTFKIKAQNGSGESGTATLTQKGSSVVVKLALIDGTGMQPAHIHKGTCAKLDPNPAYPLMTVSDGKSTTTLHDMKLSTLTAGGFAINVHKSTTDIKDYVACGSLYVPH